ncbi:MAG TPA: HYR domain-containing protein [Solirubrobacter sp.]|nr:HYR domain-containing protein [Solirubrobacter sp.]
MSRAVGAGQLQRRRLPFRRLALTVALSAAVAGGPATAAAEQHAVGHRVVTITGHARAVDVDLWYPADATDAAGRPETSYTSRVAYGVELPAPYKPLSWRFAAELAVENPAVDPNGAPFPVIVFSHGSVNDPINSSHLLERIAAAGFIIAAPAHVTDTQEDVRIDFINGRLGELVPDALRRCPLGLSQPCSRPGAGVVGVAPRMVDRAIDLRNVLDQLPGWFDGRADMSRVGVLGHSRGTVTGVTAAAGSQTVKGGNPPWGIEAEARVKAVLGMASAGAVPVTVHADLDKVDIPTVIVAGGRDQNSPLPVNQALYDQIGCPVGAPACAEPNAYKRFILLPDAHHRTFIGTFCDQFQAVGAIARSADGTPDPNAIFETGTLTGNLAYQFLTQVNSGRVMDYCSLDTFRTPVDISSLAKIVAGFCIDSPLVNPGPGPCTTTGTVPTSGYDEDTFKVQMAELAVEFFTTHRVRDTDDDGMPDAFDETRYGTVAPVLNVPGSLEAPATSPAGATVGFSPSAVDDLDGPVPVTCAPASGNVFAIGTTTVTCSASDRGGNTSTAQFTVTVFGAAEQLADLIDSVVGATGLPPAIKNQLTAGLKSQLVNFDPSRPLHRLAACVGLRTFTTVVRVLAPTRTEWLGAANRIRAVLAC